MKEIIIFIYLSGCSVKRGGAFAWCGEGEALQAEMPQVNGEDGVTAAGRLSR